MKTTLLTIALAVASFAAQAPKATVAPTTTAKPAASTTVKKHRKQMKKNLPAPTNAAPVVKK
jgi:hypothetical protein